MATFRETPSGIPRRWSASDETLKLIDIELCHFYSDGYRIAAHMYKPRELKEGDRRPGIVLIHGFMGIKEILVSPYAEAFAKEGWVALCFDFRGFGESDGRQRGRLFWDEQVEDSINAITFLKNYPGVDKDRIGVWGTSYGGALAPYVLAVDPRVKTGVSQVGFADGAAMASEVLPQEQREMVFQLIEEDRARRVLHNDPMYAEQFLLTAHVGMRDWFEEVKKDFPQLHDREIPVQFLEKHMKFSPLSVIDRKGERPLLLIAATRDDLTPVGDLKKLYEKAPEPKEWLEIDCGHHDIYEGEIAEKCIAHTIKFYKNYL